MTDGRFRLADAGWQAVVVRAGVAFVTILVGRIACGATFGYVIFLLVWLPILAAWACEQGRSSRRWISGGAAMAVIVGWLAGWPPMVALQLSAMLLLFAVTVAGWAVALRALLGRAATVVAVIGWLSWLTMPLLMAGPLQGWLPETVFAEGLAVHPVIACNQIDVTSGDWTHQGVAYATLTRLGQDLTFDWPESLGPTTVLYGAFAFAAWIGARVVPRGTIYGRK